MGFLCLLLTPVIKVLTPGARVLAGFSLSSVSCIGCDESTLRAEPIFVAYRAFRPADLVLRIRCFSVMPFGVSGAVLLTGFPLPGADLGPLVPASPARAAARSPSRKNGRSARICLG